MDDPLEEVVGFLLRLLAGVGASCVLLVALVMAYADQHFVRRTLWRRRWRSSIR